MRWPVAASVSVSLIMSAGVALEFRNVTATDCPNAGQIWGLPEAPITDVTLSNVTISATKGMQINYAKGIRFIDSKINVQEGNPLTTFSAEVTGLE